MKQRFFICFLFGAISLNFILADNPETKGLSYISKDNLQNTVSYLASKDLAGRLAGSDGYEKAAKFMADRFRKLNLKPYSGDSYFQKHYIEYNEILSPCKLYLVENDKISKEFKLGKDFILRGFSGSGNFTAPVVFCGYGISMPKIAYDDYERVDVKDKVVMVFKPNPAWKIKNHEWTPPYERTKAFVAKKHGAIGILYVSLPVSNEKPTLIGSVMHGEGVQDENFPQLHISIDVADKLIEQSGYATKNVQMYIDSVHRPFSLPASGTVKIQVNTHYVKKQPTENIIGIIEGTDEKLKNEYVIVGAHLDHVGSQAGEIFFPGANDNASGSATVLEIAQAFAKAKIKPKRSIAFVLFDGEEQGMLGSNYFVDSSKIKTDNIVAMLNIDCVGHGDSLNVRSGKLSPNLWNIAKQQDDKYTKIMINKINDEVGADAGPFFRKNIPTLSFVTTNSYEFLHMQEDTPSTLNPVLHEKVTKLVFLITLKVANGEYTKEVVTEKK
jgi:hypothetical protein